MKTTLRQTRRRVNSTPQCAFKISMFNVAAIHINFRVSPRFSSTYEPSDPPFTMIWFGKFPGAKPNIHPTTGASQNTSLNHPIGSSDGRARAAPDIEGHHRPVIALFRAAFNLPVPLRKSRSLSELTRQIAPPTKNGHAPLPTESRKSCQSVNPFSVRAG
ncbi:hypothetical protein TPS_06149 [Trichinella pseudospiralis]